MFRTVTLELPPTSRTGRNNSSRRKRMKINVQKTKGERVKRIIGGKESGFHHHPWQVNLCSKMEKCSSFTRLPSWDCQKMRMTRGSIWRNSSAADLSLPLTGSFLLLTAFLLMWVLLDCSFYTSLLLECYVSGLKSWNIWKLSILRLKISFKFTCWIDIRAALVDTNSKVLTKNLCYFLGEKLIFQQNRL